MIYSPRVSVQQLVAALDKEYHRIADIIAREPNPQRQYYRMGLLASWITNETEAIGHFLWLAKKHKVGETQ